MCRKRTCYDLRRTEDSKIYGCDRDDWDSKYEVGDLYPYYLDFDTYYTCDQKSQSVNLLPAMFVVDVMNSEVSGDFWWAENSLVAIYGSVNFIHKPKLTNISLKLRNIGHYISWGVSRNDCKHPDNTVFATLEDAWDFGLLTDYDFKGGGSGDEKKVDNRERWRDIQVSQNRDRCK